MYSYQVLYICTAHVPGCVRCVVSVIVSVCVQKLNARVVLAYTKSTKQQNNIFSAYTALVERKESERHPENRQLERAPEAGVSDE